MTYTIACPYCDAPISYTRDQMYTSEHALLKEYPICQNQSRLVMSDAAVLLRQNARRSSDRGIASMKLNILREG
jgi:hypothetical protein